MIPITVHVPENRVSEFYVRFGEFLQDEPSKEHPLRLDSGLVPGWIKNDDAQSLVYNLWDKMSLQGHVILTYMARKVGDSTVQFRPDEIAKELNNPNGVSGIAGLLGGVGRAIRRVDLPMYLTPKGKEWHYLWDWDGESYSMTPEVAKLLRNAAMPGARP